MKQQNSTSLSQARSRSPLLLRGKFAAANASESLELLSKITGLAFKVQLLAHPYLVVSSLSALTEETNEPQNSTPLNQPFSQLPAGMEPARISTMEFSPVHQVGGTDFFFKKCVFL